MLEAINGILGTVAVTSLNAYNNLSAGVKLAVWPTTAIPISFTCFIKSLISTLIEKPGILSSLSKVPPV